MDDERRGMQLVHRLRALTVELDLLGADFARRNGLHPTDLRALIALLDAARDGVPATPGRLAEQLRLDASSVTALVDRLERLGHVRRERDPADRRRVLLRVDEPAVAMGWSFFGPLIEGITTVAESFDETELATVDRFLRRVAEAVTAGRAAG
ncbi:MarR family winged helix-turn-helix transcriptional regulator [Modestobacter sp. URMC 112]